MPLDGGTTKTRPMPFRVPGGKLVQVRTSNAGGETQVFTSNAQVPSHLQGRETTFSENHARWRGSFNQAFSGDIGGPFRNTKTYVRSGIEPVTIRTTKVSPTYPFSVWRDTYHGVYLPCSLSSVAFPPDIASSESGLDVIGSAAIAACKPTNATADLSVFLGELIKDGLPKLAGMSLMKEKTRAARHKAADEYLNLEFGWKPIARDFNKIAQAVYTAHLKLAQYERDSGRLVRRRYSFPPVTSESSTVLLSNVSPVLGPSATSMVVNELVNKGKVIRVHRTSIRRWFSGAFTYHLPSDYYARGEMARRALMLKKSLGLALTPEVLWNLSPWSWLADWFSNAGDVLSNVSDWASDGLVLRYGYVMEHTISSYTYVYVGPNHLSGSAQLPSILTTVRETKVRRRATPFGFGLNWDGFTPRQLAILSALGISRS